ncbi:MAG: hypothetical protein R8K48_08065 [Gallionella sp.]
MDKNAILILIIEQLQADLVVLEQAVALARDTATHADCLGSSKYETMGLEASYLAQGQGVRLLEVERSLAYFTALLPLPACQSEGKGAASQTMVALSSLLVLQDDEGHKQILWFAAEAGGLKVQYEGAWITVITPQAPLGRAVTGKVAGDAFELSIAGSRHEYDVIAVY